MIAVCAFVDSGAHLERILASADVPNEFGLLSIDIDSFDYDVWKNMDAYRTAVVVIKIDSGIDPAPAGMDW